MAKKKPVNAEILEDWTNKLVQAPSAALLNVALSKGAISIELFCKILEPITKFVPYGGQLKLLQANDAKTKIAAGGNRSGKSRYAARECSYVLATKSGARIWVVASSYELARPLFRYVVEDIQALKGAIGIHDLSMPQEGPWSFKTSNGGAIQTKSAEDVRKLQAESLTLAVMEEAASLGEDTWDALAGRLLEQGGTLVLSGVFHGSHGFYVDAFRRGETYPNEERIISASLRSWDNRAIFPPCNPATCNLTSSWEGESHGSFHNPKIQSVFLSHDESWFRESIAAAPMPDRALVIGQEFQKAVHWVPFNFRDPLTGPVAVKDRAGAIVEWDLPKDWPVYLAVDPGYSPESGFFVGAFQLHDRMAFCIDEYFEQGKTTSQVIQAVKERPWWMHVRGGWADVAATQHAAMPSVVEVFQKEAHVFLRSQKVHLEDSIERLRFFLKPPATPGFPRLYFNSSATSGYGGICNRVLFEAQNWRYKIVEDPRQPLPSRPIERFCDGLKATAYLLVGEWGKTGEPMTAPITQTYDGAYLNYTPGATKAVWVG